MAYWPKLPEVRSLLRLQPDPTEDAVIGTALAAAIDYGNRRMNLGGGWVEDGTLPDAAHQACLFHAARLYRRRDSIDGTIGFGDLGVVRVGRTDVDRDDLYAVIAPLVFG
jgi:hypothetical protein